MNRGGGGFQMAVRLTGLKSSERGSDTLAVQEEGTVSGLQWTPLDDGLIC